MSKIEFQANFYIAMERLNQDIKTLNESKVRLLFDAVDIGVMPEDLERILDWELIAVAVPDRQMARQLNTLFAYVPNLMFIVDPDCHPFEVSQGIFRRRIWKNG